GRGSLPTRRWPWTQAAPLSTGTSAVACSYTRQSLHERRIPPIRCRHRAFVAAWLDCRPNNTRAGRLMARQFIYHMQGLTKTYPGNRKVLENINLSFYPDAKIGVLGVNGSGKSTLLRIMAGIDK